MTEKAIYILGGEGNEQDNCQEYDFETGDWSIVDVTGMGLINVWKSTSYSQYTIKIDYVEKEPELYNYNDIKNSCFIFGTDDEPFIFQLNKKNYECKVRACPLSLKLQNFQAVCKISETKYLLAGGINKELKKIQRTTYVIDMVDNSVEICPSMNGIRYTFPVVCVDVILLVYYLGQSVRYWRKTIWE